MKKKTMMIMKMRREMKLAPKLVAILEEERRKLLSNKQSN